MPRYYPKKDQRVPRYRRHARIRVRVSGTPGRPRLCVFRSSNEIYAQVIDDLKGHTLAAASSIEETLRSTNGSQANKTARAALVGALLAQRAREKGIEKVVFDRGGYQYHGRVKALAEAARKAGLSF
ncbi:MAG: 50S ribosomal protein L18 [Chloroflexi bacterium]|nr:50S ribosomal protein L18 [Chloroflexota bacterium]